MNTQGKVYFRRNRSFVAVLALTVSLMLSGCLGSSGADDSAALELQDNSNVPGSQNQSPQPDASGPAIKGFPDAAVGARIRQIDEARLKSVLEPLTGAAPMALSTGLAQISERGTSTGRKTAAQYMKESFEKLGLTAKIITFQSGGYTGYNVEGVLQGKEGGRHLYVSAHLDSATNAGANDDASGLASLLMMAWALQGSTPRDTIHFLAFDLEELGLLGSSSYVATLNPDGEILGNIHSDMIGYDDGGYRGLLSSCNKGGELDDAVIEASRLLNTSLAINEQCIGRSDHQTFWNYGIPAVLMTDNTAYDDYPWYHAKGDTVDKLSLPFLRDMIQLTATAVGLLVL